MSTQKYLVHSFKRLMIIGLVLLAISSAIIFSIVEYFNYQQRVDDLQSIYTAKQEALLKKDVEQSIEMVAYEKKVADELLEKQLRSIALIDKAMIERFEVMHSKQMSQKKFNNEIGRMLDTLVLKENSEHFILFDQSGKIIHQRNFNFISTNKLFDFKTSDGYNFFKQIVQSKDKDFSSLQRFFIPSVNGSSKDDSVIIYTTYIPSLRLYLSHAKLMSEHIQELQKLILRKLSHMQKIKDGYIFAGTYQGTSLLGPSVGHNMWEVQDSNGLYVVQELVQIAKQGKGYLRYRMPRQVNLSQLDKLSYVEGLEDWGWYIGAGIYLDDINQMISDARKELIDRSFRHIFLIIVFYLFVLFIFFALSDEISAVIREQIERFKRDFKLAEEGIGIISRSGIEYIELDSIAESANRMIEARLKIEQQSEEKSNELERVNTELKVKTKEAVQATEAKARFLANMSHEIRTPLNAIIGMGDVLYDSPLSLQQKDYLGILKRSSEHLLILINDILDFSKIESGKIGIEKELIDFVSLCEDSLGLVANRFPRVIFSLHYDESVNPYIHSDPFRLRQVLLNLLSNAGKATPEGEVCLHVYADSELHIDVIDTGVGIDEQHLEIIFELFSQIDGSFDKKYEGTGLGLAISRSLARLLEGEISVASKLGGGSTFTLTLPLSIIDDKEYKDRVYPILNGKSVNVFSPYHFERLNLTRIFKRLGADVKLWQELDADFFQHAHQLYIGFGADGVSKEVQELISSCPMPIVWSPTPGQNIHGMNYLPLFNMLKRPLHLSALFNFFLRVEGNLNELRYNPIDLLIIDQDLSYGKVLEQQILSPFVRHVYYAHNEAGALNKIDEHDYGLILLSDSICANMSDFIRVATHISEAKGGNALCLMLNQELEDKLPPPINRLQSFNKLSSKDYIFQLIYGILSTKQYGKDEVFAAEAECKRKVLVVDDSASNLLLVQVMLKDLPIDVVLASSGKEAIEFNEKQGPFDLILMDIQMPEMDGMTAVELIRSKERELDHWPVTIFALTAYALKEEHVKIMASGCNGILTKPIQKHVLCNFMREFYRLPAKGI